MTGNAPEFTGITRYQDPSGHYTFRHPWDWRVETLDEGGVVLHPEDAEPATFFAALVSRGGVPVEPADLDSLAEGFDAGLSALPGYVPLAGSTEAVGTLIRLEREFTFTEDATTRRRHTWALYAGTLQLLIVYQGATPEAYDYWLPMGNYCYATLDLAPDSWYIPESARP